MTEWDNAEYGDTVDRFQWEKEISSLFVRLSGGQCKGLVNQDDDTLAANATIAYRTERCNDGDQPAGQTAPSRDFTLFTADLAAEANLGKLNLRFEGVGQFGGGDLENGANDVQITACAVLGADGEIGNFDIPLGWSRQRRQESRTTRFHLYFRPRRQRRPHSLQQPLPT